MGTTNGKIIKITHDGQKIIESHCHSSRITAILVDDEEKVLVSIGLDGKMLIKPLISDWFDDMEYKLRYGPLTSICFAYKFDISKFAFYIGTMSGKFIYFEQGWLSPKETILSEHTKPINYINVYYKFVIFSDSTTIYISDIYTKDIITAIPRPEVGELSKAELDITPCILWETLESNLIRKSFLMYISWYNAIRIFSFDEKLVKQRFPSDPETTLEVKSKFYIESTLFHNGITLFTNRILLYAIQPDYNNPSRNIHVIKILNKKNESLYEQNITPNIEPGFEAYQYKCCFDLESSDFLIYNGGAISVIHPITVEEKLKALKKNKKYEDCLKLVTEFGNELSPEIVQKVESEYIDYLIQENRFREATEKIKSIKNLEDSKWKNLFTRFREINKLDLLFDAIICTDVKLPIEIYELFPKMCIEDKNYSLLESSISKLCEYIEPSKILTLINNFAITDQNLFTIPEIQRSRLQIAKILDHAELAVPLCIQLKDTDVFNILNKHKEIKLPPLVLALVNISPQNTVKLVKTRVTLKATQLVPYLKINEKSLFEFLDAAFLIDPEYILEFHNMMPEMYIKYAPNELMYFLKNSISYNAIETLKLCKEHNLLKEQIYLFDKLADKKSALALILEQKSENKISQACSYIIEKDPSNQELWECILNECKNNTTKLSELFNYLEYYENQDDLMKLINADISLQNVKPGLQNSLDKMQIKANLYTYGVKIAAEDLKNSVQKYIEFRKKGYQILQECSICHKRLFPFHKTHNKNTAEIAKHDNLLIFFCGHHIHSNCFQITSKINENGKLLCPVCGGKSLIQTYNL